MMSYPEDERSESETPKPRLISLGFDDDPYQNLTDDDHRILAEIAREEAESEDLAHHDQLTDYSETFVVSEHLELGPDGHLDLADGLYQKYTNECRNAITSKAFDIRMLTLSDNALTSLPTEIADLKNLEILDLGHNPLSSLPDFVGNLSKLWSLRLDGAEFSEFPQVLRDLPLAELYLDSNGFSDIDLGSGVLARSLQQLTLDHNGIADFPSSVLNCTELTSLSLVGNAIESIPMRISELCYLKELNLSDNELTSLPESLTDLSDDIFLILDENPLDESIFSLYSPGDNGHLFTYLKSLAFGAHVYEAKLILVGEGNVGKSSLLAALRDESFIQNRLTTHGIELAKLEVEHPGIEDGKIVFNTWDFGGQEVYRITHQFFFTAKAVFLVVWKPREGQEENAIEGWCRRIKLRVGQDARIVIVATHGDERQPEFDYPALKRSFGEMLVGQYVVDNATGVGIEDLREKIGEVAADLSHMGGLMNRNWVAARDKILSTGEAEISRISFERIASEFSLSEQEVAALSSLMHELGYIIHYADDDWLNEIVVLQPEWLTKAIGYVLEDRRTRDLGGVISHAHLSQLWEERGYPRSIHNYFLRLMEKFDVSYRLPDSDQSLIGQLVPYPRPPYLPWANNSSGLRRLSVICKMSDVAPGLIAWLTVRNHRFSTNTHWRRGVFLRHNAYASDALLDLSDSGTDLRLIVTASSPDYFYHLLKDGIENLIETRWRGLKYDFRVPCPRLVGGELCGGLFPLNTLQALREKSRRTITCLKCAEDSDVNELLTGFPNSINAEKQLNDLHELAIQQLNAATTADQKIDQINSGLAAVAQYSRRALQLLATEVVDCPHLFTLVPAQKSRLRHSMSTKDMYLMTLWCEQPGAVHPVQDAQYEMSKTKEEFKAILPYARFVVKAMRLIVPLATATAGVIIGAPKLESLGAELELMGALTESVPDLPSSADETTVVAGQSSTPRYSSFAGARPFRHALLQLDPSRTFGGMRSYQDESGDIVWVCPDHYRQAVPDLPTIF
jgi:internalin A